MRRPSYVQLPRFDRRIARIALKVKGLGSQVTFIKFNHFFFLVADLHLVCNIADKFARSPYGKLMLQCSNMSTCFGFLS